MYAIDRYSRKKSLVSTFSASGTLEKKNSYTYFVLLLFSILGHGWSHWIPGASRAPRTQGFYKFVA